jgi:iron complex transport system ATP-binding protein
VVAAGVQGELPGERTAVTTGLDAVIAGFFSASTLWPNLHVTGEMRERAVEALERMEAHTSGRATGGRDVGRRKAAHPDCAGAGAPAAATAAGRALQRPRPGRATGAAREPAAGWRSEGTGLVLVTHHLGDILPEIERVILMRAGRIVADGPREELLTEARLSELFHAPVRIGRDEEWLHSW